MIRDRRSYVERKFGRAVAKRYSRIFRAALFVLLIALPFSSFALLGNFGPGTL
jgi:hypothetical protein